ncbi:MAG: hypothetical protein IJZ16_09240 [Clostridia bacterium]|nr:hypothetical protein [Clostridia bacterium]
MTFDVTLEEQNTAFDVDFCETTIISDTKNPLEHVRAVSFASTAFPEGYELELNMPVVESLASILVNATGIKKLTLKGNTSGKALDFNNAFASKTLEVIDATDFVLLPKTADNVFCGAKSLREIKGVIDLHNCTSAVNAFNFCYALEDFELLPNSIAYQFTINAPSNLSEKTVQSIIDALMNVGGTLDLHSDVVARLTEYQILEITNKNWVVRGVMSVESE